MVYLDNAASTPLLPAVWDRMVPCIRDEFGNPSSLHGPGRAASKAIDDARNSIAGCLGTKEGEIVFVSCATEANNLAILGVAEALRHKGNHVITTQIEHPSVLEACKVLELRGYHVTRLPVDCYGRVNPQDVAKALRPETILLSVMWVNNEVGTIQPIREIREAAGKVSFHTDAVQALGKVPVNLQNVDVLTFSGHKMHGPRGGAGIWIRRGTPLAPQIVGGGQERGRRSGTENTAAIVGLAEAMKLALAEIEGNSCRMRRLRERLKSGLSRIRDSHVSGHPSDITPHILNMIFDGIDAEGVVLALAEQGICVSSGSACAAIGSKASHVLTAMGVSPQVARGSVRFSLSCLTTEADIDAAVDATVSTIEHFR